jgi:uncharacterized membrane protein
MGFTPIILAHLSAALAAVAVGGATFLMKKGTARHRLCGRTWVLLMAFVAVSSFWIKTGGHWSWIHLLSVGTLAGLAAAIFAILHKQVQWHRRAMSNLYLGLLIAGLFTLLPERLLGALVWHAAGLT